jgi:hypothetical protein
MTTIERPGRCLCGAVRFLARGEPKWVAHCHCEDCRRATSAAFTTYAGYAATAVEWVGEPPSAYRSSPGVTRRFCRHCGSPSSFEGEKWPNEIHLFLASFENPEDLAPRVHVHVEEQLAWVHLADGLPRFARTPRDGPALVPTA